MSLTGFSMRHVLLRLSLAMCLSWAPLSQAESTPSLPPRGDPAATDPRADAYRTALTAAHSAARAGDVDEACRLYQALVGDRYVPRLLPAERRVLFSSASEAMRRCDRAALALRYLQRATRELPDPADHFNLAWLLDRMDRHAQARDVYVDYIRRWPKAADETDTELVWSLYRASSQRPDQQRRLLQAMFDAGFEDPIADTSPMWFELARLHLDHGDLGRARAAALRVTAPEYIVRMRVDRRFDPVIDRASDRLDVARQAQRAIEAQSKKVDARPHDLEAWLNLTYALLDADRNDAVIEMVQWLLKTSDPGRAPSEEGPEFSKPHMRPWLMNNRALALYRRGRVREAAEELERAIRSTGGDAPNVSQTLNLGVMRCRAGDPQQAVEGVRSVTGMSAYGKIVQGMVNLCAATQAKDPAGVEAALETIRAHADDHRFGVLDALLWAGRLDDAEQLYLQLIEDRRERSDALIVAQTFLVADHLPVARDQEEKRLALLARPAVRKAVDQFGRTETFPVRMGHGFD